MGMRFVGAVSAMVLGCFGVAQARDPSLVVRSDPAHLRAEVIRAAEKLCAKALAHDRFNDFGTQDECVDETVGVALGRAGNGDAQVTASERVATLK